MAVGAVVVCLAIYAIAVWLVIEAAVAVAGSRRSPRTDELDILAS